MDEMGRYSMALYTLLYAAKQKGIDLDELARVSQEGIVSNSIRPLPQDQDLVIRTIKAAIKDVTE